MHNPDASIPRPDPKGQTASKEGRGEAQKLAENAAEGIAALEQTATGAVYSGRDALASRVAAVGRALQYSSAQLRDDHEVTLARYAGEVGIRTERFAESLKRRDLAEATETVRRLATERPVAFVGGALALGFAAARFLVSGPAIQEELDE